MATTLVAGHVGAAGVTVAHVGDSRAYLFRDGALERLTADHSLVAALVERGRLHPAAARRHPLRSVIMRSLGPGPAADPEVTTVAAQPGDILMLCSDGLSNTLDDDAIARLLASTADLDAVVGRLAAAAVDADGRDDVSAVVALLG